MDSEPRRRAYERFRELVRGDDAAVPLDEAAILLAAGVRGEVDVIGELARLDELAAAVPSPTVGGLVRHLFGEAGFRGDRATYDDPRNSSLPDVLDRRMGMPITLGLVMVEVGRRVGVPLSLVGLPGHVVVHAGEDTYVDAFDGGALLDRDGCAALVSRLQGREVPLDPAWLAPMAHRAVLSRILNNLQASFARRADRQGMAWVLRLKMAMPASDPRELPALRRLAAPFN